MAAVTNYCKLGGLKQHIFILSFFLIKKMLFNLFKQQQKKPAHPFLLPSTTPPASVLYIYELELDFIFGVFVCVFFRLHI